MLVIISIQNLLLIKHQGTDGQAEMEKLMVADMLFLIYLQTLAQNQMLSIILLRQLVLRLM